MVEHARVCCKETGISLIVSSDAPGFQFYSGNFLNNTALLENGKTIPQYGAFCIEHSGVPDAIHFDQWKSQVILNQGQTWSQKIIYKFEIN